MLTSAILALILGLGASEKLDKHGMECLFAPGTLSFLRQKIDEQKLVVYWDSDGDGVRDVVSTYRRIGGTQTIVPWPDVVMMDLDNDGEPETIMLDTQGNGNCEDYKDFTGAFTERKPL